MLSPPKPWEIPSNNFRSVPVPASSYTSRAATGIRKVERRAMEENGETKQPPEPPPRPQKQTNALANNYGKSLKYNIKRCPSLESIYRRISFIVFL